MKKPKAGAPLGNKNAAKNVNMNSRLNALSCTSWQKAGWVKSAKTKGQKLPDWVRDSLDTAARKGGIKI